MGPAIAEIPANGSAGMGPMWLVTTAAEILTVVTLPTIVVLVDALVDPIKVSRVLVRVVTPPALPAVPAVSAGSILSPVSTASVNAKSTCNQIEEQQQDPHVCISTGWVRVLTKHNLSFIYTVLQKHIRCMG